MTFAELAADTASWLAGDGPDAEIVASSRIRLARNLAGTPFPHRASADVRRETFESVVDAVNASPVLTGATVWNLAELSSVERRLLVERHLASPQLLKGEGPRGVLVGRDESLGIQVNEEDHVRIQSVVSGFDPVRAFDRAVALDRDLESRLDFAVSPEMGYLTACPTNVGTAMRASILVHLPALVLANEIKKVHRAVGEMGLAVRGWFGEGSGALGDFYQLSNQRTLGRSEEEAIAELTRVMKRVREIEVEARERLQSSEARARKIEDRVHRSLGTLRHARLLTVEQTMACTSDVRLGRWMGILEATPLGVLNRVILLSQPAHLACRLGRELDDTEERWERAAWVRPRFGGEKTAAGA
jgi:protein arginine kinase